MARQEKDEGIASDILRRRLTPKDRMTEMKKRGLDFEKRNMKFNVLFFVALFLYSIPTFAYHTQLKELNFFAELQTIEFPIPIVVGCVILLIPIAYLDFYAYRLRRKKGGLEGVGHAEEWTLVFIREGPYEIVRHPTFFALVSYFILGTVILSFFRIRFTILTILGDILLILMINLSAKYADEPLGIIKWGETYRRYMREVPRFNLILGTWRWNRRRKGPRILKT